VHDALYKKRIWLEGIQDKTITDDGAKCAFPFVFSLELELKLELQKNQTAGLTSTKKKVLV
jgi:hypothetical protein